MRFLRFRCVACASFLLIAGSASAAKIVSCRGQWGTVEFLDAKGRTVKFFTNKEHRREKGGMHKTVLARVYGCLKGKYAYIVHQISACANDEPCNEDEMSATLEIYDHTGQRTWKENISISDSEEVVVPRSDERVLFSPLTPPFGVVAIDPKGNKNIISFEGGHRAALSETEISPSGRYGIARLGADLAFFDVITGKTHIYTGPGKPWVNDEGKFEVWVGSVLKNDWSLGPDGKKVYEYKFE